MYKLGERYVDTNGYTLVYIPDHPKAIASGSFQGYVYEHVLIAEEMLGRPIQSGDVVHHLDENRSNNSPDNLLVLSGPMHSKLHTWLSKNTIVPNDEYRDRTEAGCVRCMTCKKPIKYGFKYCSRQCCFDEKMVNNYPSKEELEKMVWLKPTSQIAVEFNVSDSAIGKLCKKLGIEKPGRGYWAKKNAEKKKYNTQTTVRRSGVRISQGAPNI